MRTVSKDSMGEIHQYTFEEVSKQTGQGGTKLWVVYKNDVLDLTRFESEHPGGGEVILEEGGRDCTRAFDDVGHSRDAKDMMHKYKIGEIVADERKYGANGKKLAMMTAADAEQHRSRSCLSVITCGLL